MTGQSSVNVIYLALKLRPFCAV